MKKLIIVIGLCSVVLFGADIKAVTVSAKASATAQLSAKPMSPKVAKFLNLAKKAKVITPIEQVSAQITINVPANIESLEENGYEIPTGWNLRMACALHNKDSNHDQFISFLPIHYGEETITFRFNGLSKTELAQLDTYYCLVLLVNDAHTDYADIHEITGKEQLDEYTSVAEGKLNL